MKRLSTWVFISVFSLILFINTPVALADAAREEKLESMVMELLQRVEALEKKLAEKETESEVGSRLDNIEQTLQAAPADNTFRVYWKEGLRMDTADNNFKMKIGGRVHNDWIWGDMDNRDFQDGVRFRRARLYLSGQIYENIKFKWQYDFAGDGTGNWKDVYAAFTGLDAFDIKIGQFKEPFSLEELTSSNYITFLERSPATSTLAPSRETGLMLSNSIMNERMTWAAGIFRNSGDFGEAFEDDVEMGEWDFTARLTGLPWWEEEGKRLLHLGAGFSHRSFEQGDTFRFRSRGSHSTGGRLVDTGAFAADDLDLFGAEAAINLDALSVQSEYMYADVNADDSPGTDSGGGIHAFYIQAGYFLTGESRPYKTSGGVFSRVKPKRNFSLRDGGPGAWELALRYSWLDLDDVMDAGQLDDIVIGLNWYLNPNARMMFDYNHSEADGGAYDDEDADVFALRLQVDF